jgi:hypothetical protein
MKEIIERILKHLQSNVGYTITPSPKDKIVLFTFPYIHYDFEVWDNLWKLPKDENYLEHWKLIHDKPSIKSNIILSKKHDLFI